MKSKSDSNNEAVAVACSALFAEFDTMIYESSKDYGTGEILMIHDGETAVQEVCDYLQRNYSQEVNKGDELQFTDASECLGMTNPAMINFSPANSKITE